MPDVIYGVRDVTEERTDVCIIGGGAIGLSCALELSLAGRRVLVLEREAVVGAGSSSRANGGVRAQFTTEINILFSKFSIEAIEALSERTSGLPAFHQVGYLLMTGTEEGRTALQEACALQRSLGVATRWVDADEIPAMAPIAQTGGVLGATFHERDGFLDPHGLVAALHSQAREAGAEIRTGTSVLALSEGSEGLEVGTSGPTVAADWVINAAGAHASEIAALVGEELPVHPVRRNLAFAPDPFPPERSGEGLIPMCVDLDTGVLVRKETGGGFVLAYSDPGDAPGWDTSVDPRFLEQLAERIGHRFPLLEALPIRPNHCWAGLYPETPDHHAVIGPVPGCERLILCAGFGGHGLMHAPAAGRAVSELVTQGECTTFPLRSLRPSRFKEGELVIESAVL